ncbi:uncharacterized protein PGTG_06425 [Puccinia graminis f. sp. tritici CRL 75-36-700-3]|uniref:SET domain-containing protein n=1 Tax=Puccinia graminis f. sp. tritici (strain CRL 75-36-700-3 / race SCCL) TaxID=418459 RepID=E3K7G5_PUCGT|nr:uncharacterized protein PGTG_06425 [Puccinia graminis f. sp. tritici CRL 75-36-700-3]EFP80469.2 hypothetical protein PGTG_06425 [Puccinia graminis f. sp. tritici CRL 75-36-700-3]
MHGATNGNPVTNSTVNRSLIASRPSSSTVDRSLIASRPSSSTVNQSLIASRPSSSTKNPTSRSPPEVITINTDDEDEHIKITSAPKAKPRTSTKPTCGLDVSSWNVGTKSKPNGHDKLKDSSSRPILSSSTNCLNHVDQTQEPKSIQPHTSSSSTNHRDSCSSSQPDFAGISKSKQPNLHARELTKERSQHANLMNTAHSKGTLNSSKSNSHPTHVSKITEDAPQSTKQGESQHLSQARTTKHSNGQNDVINKLNFFSYLPSSGSGNSSMRKEQPSGSSASTSNLSKSGTNKSSKKQDSDTSWATSALKQSMHARQQEENAKRMELKRLQSRGSASAVGTESNRCTQPGSSVLTGSTTTHSIIRSSGSNVTSSTPSALAKGNNNTSSMCASNQGDNTFSQKILKAASTVPPNGINASSEAPHAPKKRKHMSPPQSKKLEERFVELSNADPMQPVPSASCPPPRKSISNVVPLEPGPQLKQNSSFGSNINNPTHTNVNPCVIHPVATLPPPKVTPRPRPVSPDWSQVPSNRRPLQGRERPDEFSTELQRAWILTNNPDLTTPLGHLIFSEEINANQMWENQEIPHIDVVVPDEVKAQMLQDSKAAALDEEGKLTGLDQSLAPPLEFVYTDRVVYRNNERPIPPTWQCQCEGDCSDNPNCECRIYQTKMVRQTAEALGVNLNESVTNFEGFAYVSNRKPRHSHFKKPDNGDLEARSVAGLFLDHSFPVFECHSKCGCGPNCINRTVGRGRREKLSIQKTLSRGWGVFADHPIPTGRLVTHYSGELITDAMSDERSRSKYDKIGRTYLFDLDPWWIETIDSNSLASEGLIVISETKQFSEAHKRLTSGGSLQNVTGPLFNSSSKAKKKQSKSQKPKETDIDGVYSVDAFLYGNVSRFINHSCSANTVIVPVYIEDSDPTRPIFAMFAKKNIKTGTEITTSYSDPNDEEYKRLETGQMNNENHALFMPCKCNAPNCKGIMFA